MQFYRRPREAGGKRTNPSALVSDMMFYVSAVVPLTLAEG